MSNSLLRRPHRRLFATALTVLVLAAGCRSPRRSGTLAGLCSGSPASARVRATVDTVRGPGGPALASLEGTAFELRFSFSAPAVSGTSAEAGCSARSGSATFTGEIPDRIRAATSTAGTATWHTEGDTLLMDLNPGTRDNNVFVVLPIRGGRGHWGLSTFAGEVARGTTETLPER